MSEPRVAAVIVNWNGRAYLPACLRALGESTTPVRVVVVDNASTDGSVDLLRREHPGIEVVALGENRGYAGGANIGIQHTSEPYVLIMNPDVIVTPDHLAALVARLDASPEVGAVQGKLYQILPEDYVAGRTERARTIDSAGHSARRTRMVHDIGQGEPDEGRYDVERSVFSACGAALLLRREMLVDVAYGGEYFDESFFAYKEDIDLCWRARMLGWDIRVVPSATGFHVRGWAGARAPSPQSLPLAARLHSWKNHYLLIVKNERLIDAILASPFLIGWEILRQGHALLRDRSVYAAYPELFRVLPLALRKRRHTMSRRRIAANGMRRWFAARDGLPAGAAGRKAPSSSR